MKTSILSLVTTLTLFSLVNHSAAGNFQSDSKRFGNAKRDIVMTEVERNPRTSLLNIQVNRVGSSVGSSFFILCSLRDLAKQRGGFRYIVKVEDMPKSRQMLVGFLNYAGESPGTLDARLKGATVIDLDRFSPLCSAMK